MRGMRKAAVLGALGLLSAARLEAVVVDFDDLVPGGGVIAIPALYGGISWDSAQFGVYGFVQPPYTPSSPPNRALTNRLSPSAAAAEITFSFAEPVSFGGAWFSGQPSAVIPPGTVFLNLYLNGALVHTTAALALSSVPTLLGFDYAGAVDEVGIVGRRGYYVFDDVTYEAEAVPEPTTLALLGAGAAVMIRRRKKA